ncbi:CoA pyrophosphatase [Cucumibacter marinus]|uniref:CoA pyrophosphatase n=1 Tax=Cucumibacter marinus TaxID=1121252 RepID=UPI0004101F0E|nr:CoA pyrophosphatase [Cucumibacter marinus]
MAEWDEDIERIAGRLLAAPQPRDETDTREFGPTPPFNRHRPTLDAAVLIALIRREDDLHVVYTERSADLRSHSGQISFPGGKIDPGDEDAAAAAVREAEEEIAMRPSDARVIGFLPNYLTGTNYHITPVVADVSPTAPFRANPEEVAGFFEVPLAHLREPENYRRHVFHPGGREVKTWRIDFGEHAIWGITAHLTRLFRQMALEADDRSLDD